MTAVKEGAAAITGAVAGGSAGAGTTVMVCACGDSIGVGSDLGANSFEVPYRADVTGSVRTGTSDAAAGLAADIRGLDTGCDCDVEADGVCGGKL